MNKFTLDHTGEFWRGRFEAMASPCEILIDSTDAELANKAISTAVDEVERIEKKFSRYRKDNIIYQINTANGKIIVVDEETAALLDYAQQCYELSDGRFDVTSGVLRRVWKFDGSSNIPTDSQIQDVLQNVGWQKVYWQKPMFSMQEGMEVDFGGIGKEYAVDRSALLISALGITSVLVNYGGDLVALGPRANGIPWEVGMQDPDDNSSMMAKIELSKGGVATSGDLHRFLLKDGVRYSHILDTKTGWPIKNACRQVTVLASNCMEAGMLATFALLKGQDAEAFLQEQEVEYRLVC